MADPAKELVEITGGKGYDDVFVYIPNRKVAELGDQILAFDGCMNFFAGPTDSQFKAEPLRRTLHQPAYCRHHRRQ